jgi:hypothetical protein
MKKFLLKTFVFIAGIVLIQLFLPLPFDVQYKVQKMEHVLQYKPDVVYFGDSTLKWTSPKDPVLYSMPDLLKMLLPNALVVKLTHPSYQMDVYRMNVSYFLQQGFYPKYFVIPINLRSFSPEWLRQPLWQFEEERWLLAFHVKKAMKFFKPATVFKLAGQNISQYDYLHTPVYNGTKRLGIVKDFDNPTYAEFSEKNLKNKMVFRYMYRLTAQHPYVRAMKEIVSQAQMYGVGVIFYVTPIDYQSGEKCWGREFDERIADNVELIKEQLAGSNATLLDLSRTLSTSYFSWPDDKPSPLYPNEHLNLAGRMFVVKQLYDKAALNKL